MKAETWAAIVIAFISIGGMLLNTWFKHWLETKKPKTKEPRNNQSEKTAKPKRRPSWRLPLLLIAWNLWGLISIVNKSGDLTRGDAFAIAAYTVSIAVVAAVFYTNLIGDAILNGVERVAADALRNDELLYDQIDKTTDLVGEMAGTLGELTDTVRVLADVPERPRMPQPPLPLDP